MIRNILILITLFKADSVLATQAHSAPEGLYVHEIAHLFFACSMAIFIYWLRKRDLTLIIGWRYIQYAAFFFILWNSDTFLLHLFEEVFSLVHITPMGPFHIKIVSELRFLSPLYYILKLDHLFCVPALYFLHKGLYYLLKEVDSLMGEKKP